MAGNSGSKIKILTIYEILRDHSDEDHPLTANQIIQYFSNYGMTAERKAIYSDIELLIDKGFDIIKNPPPAKGYYLGERDFQLAEVRMLIDAVQSAQFITETKTSELIEKIEKSLSKHQKDYLRLQQVYVDNRNKNENETVYYTIDSLSNAIQSGKRISLHYLKRKIEAGERPKNEDYIYQNVSPYALIWVQDHYYLVCNHPKHNNLMHLRMDKISKVKIQEETARPLCEVSDYKDHFDAADYLSRTFNMFSGESERVKIRCKNSAWQIIADRFGEDVRIVEQDDETFTISANAVPAGLASWILQYGDSMVVVEPQSLRDTVKANIKAMQEAYK